MTAAVVASTLLLLRDDDELWDLVDQSSLEAVEAAVRYTMPVAGWALDHVPWRVLKRLGRAVERLVSPGFVTHYAIRKATVRRLVLDAVGDGFHQIVLLGAGFDMLSQSIPHEASVFEVDLPATQRAKRQALRTMRTRHVTYVAADLRDAPLRTLLEGTPGYAADRDTVFVAEGLLMYLDEVAVQRILTDLRSERSRTRAVLSCVTPDRKGRPRMHSQRAIVDFCMRLLDEEFVWGEPANAIRERLERTELHLDEVIRNEDLLEDRRRTTGRRFPTSGEVIVVASHAPRGRDAALAYVGPDGVRSGASAPA